MKTHQPDPPNIGLQRTSACGLAAEAGSLGAATRLMLIASLFLPRFAVAEPASIRYLRPAEFREVPAEVIQTLGSMKCLVPQAVEAPKLNNVVKGEFLHKGRTSWAILCSQHGRSSILVFDAQHREPVARLEEADDSAYLQGSTEPDRGAFSRGISAVGKKRILGLDSAYGNSPPLPKIDHDGIEDAFLGKGSRVLYWNGVKWRTLAGSD